MDKNTLDIIKELRSKTGISMGLCSEAAKESNGNIETAMKLLREKCCELGKKFYKNAERPMGHFLCFYKQEDNKFFNIKFGVESEFIANSVDLQSFVNTLTAKEDFMKFMENNQEYINEELLYLCGMLKENIQIVAYSIIEKSSHEHFLIQKKGSTPNENVVTGLNVGVITGELEEENRRNLLINISSLMNKKINNIITEKNKEIKYMHNLIKEEIDDLLGSVSVNNREIKISDLLNNHKILKIVSF
jgi:translation elongation factor EF-Ts